MCAAILAVLPDQAETTLLAGIIDAALGDADAAVRLFRRCIVLSPQLPDAYANLGGLIASANREGDPIVLLDRAIALDPALRDSWVNRGLAHHAARNHAKALADYREAFALDRGSTAALAGMGRVLRDEGRLREALALHRLAVVLAPGSAIAWQDIGHSARDRDPARAAIAFARAHRIEPDDGRIASDLYFTRRMLCDWRDDATLAKRLRAMIEDGRSLVLPLAKLLIDLDPAAQDRAARKFSRETMGEPRPWRRPAAPVNPDKRLTIAYFSADFHEHATAYLTAELFERHDRERFRVLAYSYGPAEDAPMRRRLMRAFDAFREVGAIDADRIAASVRADEVDILVDLKGYTRGGRLDLLARRLAPLQVTWLGYPGTLGSTTFDYVIGDPIVTPAKHQPWFAERIVRLPECYQANDRQRPARQTPVDRAASGLPAEGFVFGALHVAHKIGPESFAAWMRILRATPRSILWLLDSHPRAVAHLRAAAKLQGIDPDRLCFAPSLPQAAHLARLPATDLMLDSFPYTGHTTTSDALWAGVPVVTWRGRGFAARVAASLLRAADLEELVATSIDSYEALAITLARSPERLAALRRGLADRRFRCPLFDSERFARHIEAAYTLMWRRHAAGLAPAPIDVPPLPPGPVQPA